MSSMSISDEDFMVSMVQMGVEGNLESDVVFPEELAGFESDDSVPGLIDDDSRTSSDSDEPTQGTNLSLIHI